MPRPVCGHAPVPLLLLLHMKPMSGLYVPAVMALIVRSAGCLVPLISATF